jgi:serine-type D-Ala-D-Ala carboxypeptidase (penicillin-binding protein 5/6)
VRAARAILATLAALLLLAGPAAAATRPPAISAPSAIVMDADTGDVAYAKAPDQERPIASTTKLMTALVALEAHDLSDIVVAPRYDAMPAESRLGLVPGERMSMADLMRALLIVSANDAAYTIAKHVGGSEAAFVRRMNRRARQLHLDHTHYANAIGLDEAGNYSTARDLAHLAIKLRASRFFRRTVDTEHTTLRTGIHPREITNRNTLLFDAPWVNGVKTGHTTQAGDVLVSSAKRHGVDLVAVVLDDPSKPARDADSLALLRYGFTRYHRATAVQWGQVLAHVPIAHRPGALLPVQASRTVRRVVRRGDHFKLDVEVPTQVDGPISDGQRVGTLLITERGHHVARIGLLAGMAVPAANLERRTQDVLTTPWTLLVLAAVLVVATLAGGRRRRPPGDAPDRPPRHGTKAGAT